MMVMTICFGNDAIIEQSAKPLMILTNDPKMDYSMYHGLLFC